MSYPSPKVYEFAVKEVLIHRVPLVDGGISPQKKKRKHRHDITIDYSSNKSLFGNNLSRQHILNQNSLNSASVFPSFAGCGQKSSLKKV